MDMDNLFRMNTTQLIKSISHEEQIEKLITDFMIVLVCAISVSLVFQFIKSVYKLKRIVAKLLDIYEISFVSYVVNFQVTLCLAFLFFPPPTPEYNLYVKEYRERLLLHILRFLFRSFIINIIIKYVPVCIPLCVVIFCIKFVLVVN